MSNNQKVQTNISNELLKDIDSYANSLHINRTSAINILICKGLVFDKYYSILKPFEYDIKYRYLSEYIRNVNNILANLNLDEKKTIKAGQPLQS